MKPLVRSILALSLLFLVGLSVACRDDVIDPGQAPVTQSIDDLPPGIHPVLSIPGLGDAAPGSTLEIHLHLVAVEVEGDIASYQGEFRYDPEVLNVTGAAFPDGILGAWNEVSSGVIRLAGITPEGVGSEAATMFTATVLRRPSADDFEVELEEIVTGTFEDLSEEVSARPAPVLTDAVLDSVQR